MNESQQRLLSRQHTLSSLALVALFIVACTSTYAQDAISYPHPPPIKMTRDGALTSFLMLGPMPTAGLTINNALGERHCAPSAGEIYRAEQWDGWWREVPAPEGMLNIDRVVRDYAPHLWPPQYPDVFYLHTYLTATNAVRARLHIDGSLSDAHVWLGGKAQARSGKNFALHLPAGTHGLLVKCFGFQATGMAWNVSCHLTDRNGASLRDVTATLNHPGDAPAELYFRNNTSLRPGEAPSDRIEVLMQSDGQSPATRTFFDDQDVSLIISLKYLDDLRMLRAYGPAKYVTWSGFRGSAVLDVFDFWGQHTTNVTRDITIRYQLPFQFRVDLGALARGHYTMRLALRDEAGRRLMQRTALARAEIVAGNIPMQFAVISHATNMTDEVDSTLATSTDGMPNERRYWKNTVAQSRLLGSRLHMPGELAFWPEDAVFSNAVADAAPIQVWPDLTEAWLEASHAVGLPLCGRLDMWAASGTKHPTLEGVSEEGRDWAPWLQKRISSTVNRYRGRIRHWRFHNELNTQTGDAAFMKTYARTLKASTTTLAAADPTATIIAPGLTGADTNNLQRYELADAVGTNGWINLHTYSWGYATPPDLASGTVHAALRQTPRDIVISRSGHDRAYPANGVLGQTQQLTKWFAYALARPDIRKVFFSLQPGERYTPVDAGQGPYPAWVALRTMGLLMDGAQSMVRQDMPGITHAYAVINRDRHLLLLWHDADTPCSVRVKQDATYINMMDQRFPVTAQTPITVDRLPVILQGKAPLTLLAPNLP